ncbi:MAG: hypothetical protein QME81_07235 [bacterium]|nr:hypothetical protein [bacterium]
MRNKELRFFFFPLVLLIIFLTVDSAMGDAPQYAPYKDLNRHISSMSAPLIMTGMPQDAPGRRTSPAIGEEKALVILIEFTDVKHSPEHNREHFYNLVFSRTPGNKSMYNYYQECSYGQFLISPGSSEPNPTPWLESDHTMVYYNSLENTRWWKLAEEALEKAAQAGVDFSSYDDDKDGLVDHLIVVHAGEGQEEYRYRSDLLGSHYDEIKTTGQSYTLQAETSPLGIFVWSRVGLTRPVC